MVFGTTEAWVALKVTNATAFATCKAMARLTTDRELKAVWSIDPNVAVWLSPISRTRDRTGPFVLLANWTLQRSFDSEYTNGILLLALRFLKSSADIEHDNAVVPEGARPPLDNALAMREKQIVSSWCPFY